MNRPKVFKISMFLFVLLIAALALSAQEYSLQLNGNEQYVNCGSSPDNNFANALTVEAWIYPTDFKEEEHMNTIVAKTIWSYEYSHGWTLRYGSAARSLNFNMGGGDGVNWIDCKADSVLTLNTWQHVAATYDGSLIRVYVNGTEVATQAFNGGITNADNDLCIGAINHADMRYMSGDIDEVRLWNVVRSAGEINDNMLQGEVTENLVAFYRMTDGSGTTLTDNSGKGHTGTLVGNPAWSSNIHFLVPVVSTGAITNIGMYGATANGTIVSTGYPNPIQHGHCWLIGTVSQPTIDNSRTLLGPANAVGSYSSSISDLLPCKNYRVRAYVSYMVGNEVRTAYGETVSFSTLNNPLPTPSAQPASSITNTSFIVNWSGVGWLSYLYYTYPSYSFSLDVSADSSFSWCLTQYNHVHCGTHSSTAATESFSYPVTGLTPGTTYYYRIRASSYGNISPYSVTIPVTTLAALYNVYIDTGNITGVRILTSETDYGIDPESPLIFTEGFSGTVMAEKEDYIFRLAEGSDSDYIAYLSSDISISFMGTYTVWDSTHPGFAYQGEQDIPISVAEVTLEDLSAPLPPLDPGDAIVVNFSGTAESDIAISVPTGTWYAIAYYDDPENGGLTWHHGNPYPAHGPQAIIFSNLPFGAKSEIPVIISSEDVTLPVELSSFTALAASTEYVTLCWVTQSETNLQGFMVLRNLENSLDSAVSVSSLIPATNTSQTMLYSFQDLETAAPCIYYYWLQILNLDGSLGYHGPLCVSLGAPDSDDPPAIPLANRLLPAYPNPFNPTTTIHYELKAPEQVRFAIYSAKGQLIDTCSQYHNAAGRYSWIFRGVDKHGRALASGVYICVMTAGKHSYTNKMVLMK